VSGGPLAGVKVVELGGIGPGPFATLQLAGMGADVVRVERLDAPAGPVSMGRGKRSIAVDLRSSAGAEVVLGLVERAAILVEGFRPGVAERLGLGPDECLARNPALVYGRMTGWGQHGPWAHAAGHDINYIGLTGALHAIGRAGEPPAVPLCLVGDLGGGAMFLVAGVLAALHEATHTGVGQVVDAAIVDGAAALMFPIYEMAAAGQWTDERGTNLLDTGRPWYDVYACADGRWVSVGAIEDRFYAAFLDLLGLDAAANDRSDPAGWPGLRARIAARLAEHDRDHWEKVFAGTDGCVAPVLSLTEAAGHPQLAARSVLGTPGTTPTPAPAPRFGRHDADPAARVPLVGADTRAVLESWTPGVAVDQLVADGVIADGLIADEAR
jgi:alpha-methylacyl-CoA racemase